MASSGKNEKKNGGKKNPDAEDRVLLKLEIVILLSLAVCIFMTISHFGIGGFVGDRISAVLFGIFGFPAYIVPVLLFIGIAFVISNRRDIRAYMKTGLTFLLLAVCCALFQIIINGYDADTGLTEIYKSSSRNRDGGGFLGGLLLKLFCPAFGVAGTCVILVFLCIISFILLTGKSLLGTVRKKRNAHKEAEDNKGGKERTQERGRRMDKQVTGVSRDTTLVKDSSSLSDRETGDVPVISRSDVARDEGEPVPDNEPERNVKAGPLITQKAKKEYRFPPIGLLKKGSKGGGDSDAHLRETARKLEQTLQNFNVNVTVTNVSCGPSVTRYELSPEQGVKVSRIVGLADDIKLNLAASDIRIEAPIPGKSAVGIEVPNKENSTVMLRDLLESNEFRSHPSKIAFAVGRDIGGRVVVADIAKMPHLLIAGATGSGKSVCINTLIMSILYKAAPEDVKLIMIDPKVVELKVYNGIPHLLIPVVTDPKKAAGALNWAVAEMTRRYQLFADYNVRDLAGYNEKAATVAAEDAVDEEKPVRLPQIVIIVDELADLMMVAPGEVEDAICRIAQLARACGIHLVVATQRPSVNVITGLIKANMPSRIAFAVSSGVDSRTIIDMNGAEKLLGKGDMLFYPAGYSKPARVQGSFVSDREVQAVVDFLIKDGNGADYDDRITEHISAAENGLSEASVSEGGERDVYFADAGRFIIEKEKASIGMLQRVFKIGFNRAARIMDQLADAGVVGEEDGTKPRTILMTAEEFERYLEEGI